MLLALCFGAIKIVIAYVYPVTESWRAVLDRNPTGYQQWLTYWVVFFILRLLEGLLDVLFSRLPLYGIIKILFILWMVSPHFRGAHLIYHDFIHKHLIVYEDDIDAQLVKLSKQAQEQAWAVGQSFISQASSTAIAPSLQRSSFASTMASASPYAAMAISNFAASAPGRPGPVQVDTSFQRPSSSERTPSPMCQPPSPRSSAYQAFYQNLTFPVTSYSLTHSSYNRLGRNLPSPVGATQTQLLVEMTKLLDEGLFIHIKSLQGPPDVSSSTPILHLLRLSSDHKALVYGEMGESRHCVLPLIRILAVRSGVRERSIDVTHFPAKIGEEEEGDPVDDDDPMMNGPEFGQAFWDMARCPQRAKLVAHLSLVLDSMQDKDVLLPGLVILAKKAKERYVNGVKVARKVLVRQSFRHWVSKHRRLEAQAEGRRNEMNVDIGEKGEKACVASDALDSEIHDWLDASKGSKACT